MLKLIQTDFVCLLFIKYMHVSSNDVGLFFFDNPHIKVSEAHKIVHLSHVSSTLFVWTLTSSLAQSVIDKSREVSLDLF